MKHPSKTLILFLFFVLIFFLSEVQADQRVIGEDPDPNDPNSWPEAGSGEWDSFPQGDIPAHRIPDIPPESVDVNAVVDKSMLTVDQLAHNNNIDLLEDWNQLNSGVRDEVLMRLGRISEEVRTDTGGESTGGQVFDDGFQLDRISYMHVGRMKIKNGENVQYRGGVLSGDSAEEIDIRGAKSTSVDGFSADLSSFDVDFAESVLAGCFMAENVRNSSFQINGDIKVTSDPGTSYDMMYFNSRRTRYESLSEDNLLVADFSGCFKPTFTVRNVNLSMETNGVEEILVANGTANITIDPNFGFECISMTPLGSYFYRTGDVRQDFAFSVEEIPHKLCIRKDPTQEIDAECLQCTLADIPIQRVRTSGVITYLRFLFDSVGTLIDFNLQPMYLPEDNATVQFRLDDELLMVNEQTIQGMSSPVHTYVSNFLSIHELSVSSSEVHRFLNISVGVGASELSESLVSTYRTSYGNGAASIVENVYQDGNVEVLPPGHPMIDRLLG